MDRHRRGELARAAADYDAFLAQVPEHGRALRLRGVLARELGALAESRRLLVRACAASPAAAAPHNELALTCLAGGDLPGAEQALHAALDHAPEDLRALANLGALCQYRGRLAEAAEWHRRALAQAPEDLEIRCNLASALADAGRGDEALAECTAALDRAPGHPHLLAAQGAVLISMARFADAAAVLSEATRRNPADDLALVNLAEACQRLQRTAEAEALLERARQQNPDNARAVADLAWLRTTAGRPQEGLQPCTEFLARHPGERLVLAAWAAALQRAGEPDAGGLLDYQQLLVVRDDLPVPAGFAGRAAFHAALESAVLGNPSLLAEPASKATRGGRQTGELDLTTDAALAGLAGLFDEAVAAATAGFRAAGLAGHPVMAYATPARTLRVWGTVLEAGGRQAPHLHPLGYLSGVYYLRVPAPGPAGDPAQGWLEFGRPPDRFAAGAPAAVRLVEPQPGRLVLFPSWFLHCTRPFTATATRISIAFDAVPRQD